MADITPLIIDRLAKRLKEQWSFERFMAAERQRKVAAELGTERRAMNGLGRVRMEVDSRVYHYWGQRLGYKIWRDESFLRAMERDNPELRVKCRGTKEIQVGYMPASGRSKFHKTY